MSRAQQNPTGRPRRTPAALGLGIAAVLVAVVGCGAGQITQTDSQLPAVNGNEATAGSIALRDAMLAYPEGGTYPVGSTAPLTLTIVNTGQADDELLEVTSPAGTVEVTGDKAIPAGRALVVGTWGKEAPVGASAAATTPTPTSASHAPDASHAPTSESAGKPTGSSAPSSAPSSASGAPTPTSSAPKLGQAQVSVKGLTVPVYSGITIPVTFVFKSGPVTIQLPVAGPSTPRQEEHASEH